MSFFFSVLELGEIRTYIHTQLYSNSLKSFSTGLVIICRLRAGTKDFWEDHKVFKGTEGGGGISSS